MNTRKALPWMVVGIALALAACAPRLLLRVGELQTESQTVEVGDAGEVHVEIDFGAGDLAVTGGAQDLLEADFTYNVAELKPEVDFTDDRLVVRMPEGGRPVLEGISGFRNEWDLRFNDEVPMAMHLNMGAGTSVLRLGGLSLSVLDVKLGAGISTIDLTGDWANDLEVSVETGAADLTVRLPRDVGVRVEIEAGPTAVSASGLTQNGNVYTNDAYGESDVTLNLVLQAGIGVVKLELE